MGESSDYPIWDGWYSVAGPVNKFIPWAIIGLAVVGFIVSSLYCFIVCVFYVTTWGIISMVAGVVAGILYFLKVQKSVTDKDLTKNMHIFLLVCEVLCWLSWWVVGALMTLQFVMVGILSDVPFWEAFSNK